MRQAYQKSGPASLAQPLAGEAFIPGLTPGVFSLESDKGISRKVFNLGNLVFVKTILDRKRMETQGIDEAREFLLRCLAVMQPHKTSVLCRSQRRVHGGDAREFSCLRDMVEP